MSFINWGEESQEQKAIRRRFEEEQALFEQMMSAATAAAAAAAGAAGGSILGPVYCGGDKVTKTYEFPGLDFLDDSAFAPTPSELLNYDKTQIDLDTDYRAARDARHKQQNENVIAESQSRISRIDDLPEYAPSTVFHKGIVREVKSTWWLNTDDYDSWTADNLETGKSPADVMPGVKQFTFLPEAPNKEAFPASGKPGEVIYCLDCGQFYAWDNELQHFTDNFFNNYVDPVYGEMRSNRDSSTKGMNQVVLSMQPFIWASYYLPDYRIVKDNLF
jgi:hypothetical protein